MAQLRPTADPLNDITSHFFYDGEGRQVGVLDGEGYLSETVYDTAGNVSQQIRYDKARVYVAGATLADLRTLNVPTHTISFQYDGANRLVQETNYEGTLTTNTYDLVGDLISTTQAAGTSDARTTQERYDSLGRVIAQLSAQGASLISSGMTQGQIEAVWTQYAAHFAYDLLGRKISSTDQNNNTTLYFYDSDGRLTYTVNAMGEVTELRYNALGQQTDAIAYYNRISTAFLTGGTPSTALTSRIAAVADPTKDAHTVMTYKLTGQLAGGVTAEGASTTYTYDAFGDELTSVEKIDSTHSLTHQYGYDARGLLTGTIWDPTGLDTTQSESYDAFGRQTSVADSNGNTTHTEYDRLGRQVATVNALDGRTTTTYDAFSRVLTVKDALQNSTSYTYDDTARSVVVTTPEGISATTVHNREGQIFSLTAAGLTTSYSYDANGQLRIVSDNLGTLESRTYDASGRLLNDTDARGAVTTFTYDAANRVFTQTVDSATGGLGLVTTYTFDAEGRTVQVTDPRGKVTSTAYDRDGRVLVVDQDPTGLDVRTTYTYDAAGDVLTAVRGYGSTATSKTQYVYDSLGRRTQEIDDPVSLGGTLNLVTRYKYDANGNVTRKIDANGNSTWFVYDATNRLQYTIDALGGVTGTTYDADSRVLATHRYATPINTSTLGDVVTSVPVTANAAADRVTQSVYDRDGRNVYSIDAAGTVTERQFDANGNVTRVRTYSDQIAPGTYTSIAAVTAALTAVRSDITDIGGNDRVTWTAYDPLGNAAFTVDALGDVVQNTYDAAGDLISTTAYATRRPTGSTDLSSLQSWAQSNANPSLDRTTLYWYDSIGRLRFEQDADGYLHETRYNDAGRTQSTVVYDGRELSLAGSSLSAIALKVQQKVDAHRATTTTYDVLGRVSTVTDANGGVESYTYDALGNKTSFTNQNADTWNYTYDALGRMTNEIDPPVSVTSVSGTTSSLGASTQTGVRLDTAFTYDALGNVLSRTVASGTAQATTTRYAYDALGRQTITYLPAVGVYNPSADSLSRSGTSVVRTETTENLYTEVWYDALGNAYRSLDAAGNYSFKAYDALGRAVYDVDALNYATAYKYDAFGDQTQLTRYANPLTTPLSTTSASVAPGDVAGRISGNAAQDRTITTAYDTLGRVIQVTQPQALNFEANLNSPGGTTFTAGATTITEYDAFGDVVLSRSLVNPLTGTYADTCYYYDHVGNKTAAVDPVGYVTTYTYDESGNVLTQNQYAKALAAGSWNTATFAAPTPTTVFGQPGDPAGYDRDMVYTYDGMSRKTSETLLNFQYYFLNGVLLTEATTNRLTTYAYDAVGNLTQTTTAQKSPGGGSTMDGETLVGATTYSYYDALGRLIAVAQPRRNTDGSLNSNGASRDVELTPLTEMKYDALGNMVEQIQHANDAGVINYVRATPPSVASSSADRVTTILRDAQGRAIQTQDPAGAESFASYDERGNVRKQWQYVTNNDGVTEALVSVNEYDRLGRETDVLQPQRSGSTVVHTMVAYDAFGDIIHKGVYAAGAEGAWQENYDFDQAGRLWRSNSGGEVSKVYLYDLAGNATAQIEDQSVDLGGVSSAGVANSMSGTMRTETVYDLDEHAIQQRQPQFTITDSETLIDAQPVISTIPTPVPPQAIYQQMPIFDAPGMYYYAASPTDWADGGGYEQVAPPSASNPTGTYVQVPQSSYQLVQARQFNWAAPAGIGVVATFQYWSLSSPGNVLTGTVYTVAAGQFGVNISGLASGQYGYTISYSQQGSPSVFATQTGTFNTGTGSVTVASTASPAPVTVTPTTTQAFDRWGNAITVQDSGGGITQYKYNQLSQLTATLLPVTNVVDTRASVDASIARTELRNYYDLQGNLVESQDGNGFSTLETYNSAGQALTRQDSDSAHFAGGAITHNVYSGFGNLIQVTDELGYRTRNVYDNDGRLTLVAQEIQPGSFASAAPTDTTTTTNFSNYVAYTSYSYDQAGRRLTVTDANGYTTRDWYDLQGNVVREETPMIFATTYQYDVRGNKIKATDADNSYQTWTYDANGRLLGHSDLQNSAAYGFGGGTSYVYTYDYAGELKQQTSSVGQNLQYGYDAAGHETSITDTGAATAASGLQNSSSVSTFAYDGTGRQSRQTVIVDNHTQEDTRTGYDALGRIRSLDDPGYQLTYSYDGANNRTVIATTYVDNNLAVQKQTSYYRYNERNEVIISQGVETTGAVPDLTVNASQGVELTYDAKGERISVLTAGTQFQETEVVTNGNVASTTISEVTASNGLGTVNYTYDGLGRLTSIGKASNFTVVNTNTGTSTSSTFNQLFDVRTYDKGGRETSDTTSFLQNGAFSNQEVTSSYDADGNLSGQTTKTNAVTQSSVGYGTATLQSNNIWTGGFDAAGVLRGYTVGVYSTAGNLLYTTTYYNTYTLASSYLENGQTATSSGTQAPGPGATTRDYNVNYALVQTSDVNAPANDRHYANDSSGNILGEIQGQFDGVNGDPTVTQAWTAALSRTSANGTGLPQAEFFYYADSKYVGELQRSSTAFTANFDVNYTPISTQYPGITPTQVVAQAGDTPRIIAARVYGDASLWYIVADKNGLTDPNQAIIAGTTLTLPNQVVSLSNTSSSFKPFNVSQALGDTTPTQPSPPAPQQSSSSGGGCGVLGTILLVAVVIIVTVYTAGLTASALGATTDIAAATGATATTASIGTAALTGGLVTASGAPAIGTGIVAAAVGGAVGSIVSQGISILAGDQNGFNWKGVAEGAIGSAVTAGVGGSGLFSGLSTTAVGTSGVLAADAATGSVLSQGIDEHLGLQNTFSWRDVAVAAVAAPLAHAVGTEIDPNFGSPLDTAGFGTQLEANAASGLASVAVQTTIGGQVLTKTVLADAFGNALGNAIVATLQSPDTVGIPRAAANGAFGISNQQMADVNEQLSGQVAQGAAQVNESATDSNAAYLADSNTAVENQRQFVADADQTVQLSARDLNASLARSMRAVSAIPQINFPAEPVDPVVAAEYAARVGPTVDFMAAQANNTAAAGALPAQAVEPVPDQYDDMGQPLHGRSNFNRWSAMADAWESNDSLGDKIAAEWHAFNYVVPDAAQRIAERLGAQDQYSRLDQIEASPLGGTAYAIASIFGADQKTQDLALALASGTEGLLLAATGAGGRAPQFVGAQNMDSFEIKGLQNSVASSPNTAMRDNANVLGTYIDPLTNEVVSATGRLSADHIVPQDWIKAQAGFDTLTTDQQSWVLNHPLNTQGLPQSFNSSKGANLPGEWSTYRGEPLDPGYIQRQTDQGQFIQNFLQAQIDRFNALNGQ
ncbi:MAG TPA: hypothetical protein VNO35_22350 [Steroidobacteraceae bacterium]|nr:hypothetical protein [Steroidobacteraceae bacterium]